mgnify:FL=1
MRMFKIRKKVKKTKVGVIILTLVLFFTSLFYQLYGVYSKDTILDVAKIKLNDFMKVFLSSNVGYDLIKDEGIENVLVINKNKDNEILYVNYDLDIAYKLLDVITKELENNIQELKTGNVNDTSLYQNNEVLMLKLPFFIGSKNPLLVSLGPKIYVPLNFSGAILTNLKTEIKDYGLNNALVEMYVTIKINIDILYPYNKSKEEINYDVLIASSIINGRIPSFYGGVIDTKSNNVSIPIK